MDAVKKSDWKALDMPERHEVFVIEKPLTAEERAVLARGHVPTAMEDKWFWYVEDDVLYAHRSWTGYCIYALRFIPGTDRIEVTANRDPAQYTCTDEAEDARRVSELLDWWKQPQYDHDDEWLSETLRAVKGPRSGIEVMLGDITKLSCDCIVNAANRSLLGGGGVDGAIHRAAGPGLLEECRKLHGCETGEAKITGGYNLPAKYVIHTVGPIYSGNLQDEALLAACYRNSLALAKAHQLHSIAFPAISTGVYGYPADEAAKIALAAVSKWLDENRSYAMRAMMVCFGRSMYDVYQAALKKP